MEYRNYMVVELSSEPHDGLEEWMIACFPDYKTAKAFAEAFLPKTDVDRIEIWGTNQDPEDFTSCDIVYIRDMVTGAAIDFDEIGDEIPDIADANDCGNCKTWTGIVRGLSKQFDSGMRF